jgi:Holliday junction DNA helicase RuvA
MIAQLRGTLVEKSFERVVVDVGGVGYAVIVSLQTLAELPAPGREVTLRTHLHVREDAQLLFGFASDLERRAFELCLGVSGIGPKLAMAMLSAMRPEALADAIRRGDLARLSKTPGVGRKTAERLVVELRDRVGKLGAEAADGAAADADQGTPGRLEGVAQTVASALVHLGYRQPEAERAARDSSAGREREPLEVLVKEALRRLTG